MFEIWNTKIWNKNLEHKKLEHTYMNAKNLKSLKHKNLKQKLVNNIFSNVQQKSLRTNICRAWTCWKNEWPSPKRSRPNSSTRSHRQLSQQSRRDYAPLRWNPVTLLCCCCFVVVILFCFCFLLLLINTVLPSSPSSCRSRKNRRSRPSSYHRRPPARAASLWRHRLHAIQNKLLTLIYI